MRRALWLLLALSFFAQWALPVAQILRAQQVLHEGHRYALRLAPVDPSDAFRGRYLSLAFADTQVPAAAGELLQVDERVYVPLLDAGHGLSRPGAAQRQPPAAGDYLEARVRARQADGSVALSLPFDRYYLEEDAAPRIEAAYREATQRGQGSAYATIRVLGDRAVLEELYVGGVAVPRLAAALRRPD